MCLIFGVFINLFPILESEVVNEVMMIDCSVVQINCSLFPQVSKQNTLILYICFI